MNKQQKMDFQSRKLNLITYLAQLQDESVLSKIEKFVQLKLKSGNKETTEPFTIDELIERIEKSQSDFENGKFISQEELEKISKNW